MEHIREMYIASYSLPHSLQKVHKLLTIKLEEVFKEKLSKYETKDFYELEIASAGIMRGYLSVPCDMYFTMDRKINRFIESNFRIYKVEEDTIKEILEFLKQFDFKSIADDVLKHLFEYLERRIKGE